jgi:hypothetical protein
MMAKTSVAMPDSATAEPSKRKRGSGADLGIGSRYLKTSRAANHANPIPNSQPSASMVETSSPVASTLVPRVIPSRCPTAEASRSRAAVAAK